MDGTNVANSQPFGKPHHPLDRVRAINRMRGLTGLEKCVAIAIAAYDGPGGAHPTFATLAKDTARPRGSVTHAVRSLCDKGVLKRKRRRLGNAYTVNYQWSPSPEMAGISGHLEDSRESWPSQLVAQNSDGRKTPFDVAGKVGHEQEEQESDGGRSEVRCSSAAPNAPQDNVLENARRQLAIVEEELSWQVQPAFLRNDRERRAAAWRKRIAELNGAAPP